MIGLFLLDIHFFRRGSLGRWGKMSRVRKGNPGLQRPFPGWWGGRRTPRKPRGAFAKAPLDCGFRMEGPSYQSLPSTSPLVGVQAAFQVPVVTPVLTLRTLPSPRPTRQPLIVKAWAQLELALPALGLTWKGTY
jgi:hypothetical protein